MSERIDIRDNRAAIRWKLLTTASVLALTAYVSSAALAKADDSDRPTLWIELGGQMDQVQGVTGAFTAPFMSLTPAPDIYKGVSFAGSQSPARYSFGEEATITFQPEDSDWIFSAGIRYGRSHARRHIHKQADVAPIPFSFTFYGQTYNYTKYVSSRLLADTNTQNSESNTVLDFTAGKDVGLGLFGSHGTSTINAGVRIAAFTEKSSATISARPKIDVTYQAKYGIEFPRLGFYQYFLHAQAARSFKGIGPTLSWNASAALAGNEQDGELALDWGINAALLFGKQKAKTAHTTQAYHKTNSAYGTGYPLAYSRPHHSTRAHSVAVPNVGGFAGLSLKWTNAKISFGYRVDGFFGAMDTGIDTAKKSNAVFNGPYASLSVGLGD